MITIEEVHRYTRWWCSHGAPNERMENLEANFIALAGDGGCLPMYSKGCLDCNHKCGGEEKVFVPVTPELIAAIKLIFTPSRATNNSDITEEQDRQLAKFIKEWSKKNGNNRRSP